MPNIGSNFTLDCADIMEDQFKDLFWARQLIILEGCLIRTHIYAFFRQSQMFSATLKLCLVATFVKFFFIICVACNKWFQTRAEVSSVLK